MGVLRRRNLVPALAMTLVGCSALYSADDFSAAARDGGGLTDGSTDTGGARDGGEPRDSSDPTPDGQTIDVPPTPDSGPGDCTQMDGLCRVPCLARPSNLQTGWQLAPAPLALVVHAGQHWVVDVRETPNACGLGPGARVCVVGQEPAMGNSELQLDAASMRVQQTDGSGAFLIHASDVSIPTGATLRFVGDVPVIIVAEGSITIEGELSVSSTGDESFGAQGVGAGGRPGGMFGGDGQVAPYGGHGGGTAGCYAGSGEPPGGGGGGGNASGGGDGGELTIAFGGRGGDPFSDPCLAPLRGGAGGGGGAQSDGSGGVGGGAVQLVAATRIRVGAGGRISAEGEEGAGGVAACPGEGSGGSGGGAGGAILLEAPIVEAPRSALVLTGGGGGGGGSSSSEGDFEGLPGSGSSGGTSPVGFVGAGGDGAQLGSYPEDGADGCSLIYGGCDDFGSQAVGTGGGGGSAGRVRINSGDPSGTCQALGVGDPWVTCGRFGG